MILSKRANIECDHPETLKLQIFQHGFTSFIFYLLSAILFSGINFSIVSIAFTLCFVTKCTRFTLSLKLTIQLLIQIRKLSHESSTSRRGNIQNYYNKTNNFTYESFFSVSFCMVAVIILFCFLTFELHRATRKRSINKTDYIISSTV